MHVTGKIQCYDNLLNSEVIRNLGICWGIRVTPYAVIKNTSLDDICGKNISIQADQEDSKDIITHGGPPYRCSKTRYNIMKAGYTQIRDLLLQILADNDYTIDDFLEMEENTSTGD